MSWGRKWMTTTANGCNAMLCNVMPWCHQIRLRWESNHKVHNILAEALSRLVFTKKNNTEQIQRHEIKVKTNGMTTSGTGHHLRVRISGNAINALAHQSIHKWIDINLQPADEWIVMWMMVLTSFSQSNWFCTLRKRIDTIIYTRIRMAVWELNYSSPPSSCTLPLAFEFYLYCRLSFYFNLHRTIAIIYNVHFILPLDANEHWQKTFLFATTMSLHKLLNGMNKWNLLDKHLLDCIGVFRCLDKFSTLFDNMVYVDFDYTFIGTSNRFNEKPTVIINL